jgi:hypothetical protein
MVTLEERVRHEDARVFEDLALGLVFIAHVVVTVRGVRFALDVDGSAVHGDALVVTLERRKGKERRPSGIRAMRANARLGSGSSVGSRAVKSSRKRGKTVAVAVGAYLLQLARVRRAHAHEDLDIIVGASAGCKRRFLEERVLEIGHGACLSGAARCVGSLVAGNALVFATVSFSFTDDGSSDPRIPRITDHHASSNRSKFDVRRTKHRTN